MRISGLAGGGLMIGFPLTSAISATVNSQDIEINAFILIGVDGHAIIRAKNPEIGQGVKTSLPMILAEELDIPWEKVTVEQAELDRRMGAQFAGGSTGVKTNYDNLRKAGATARDMLLRAAAEIWKVAPSDCKTKDGNVIHGNKSLHYGEVATRAAKLETAEEVQLKSPEDFTIIGQSKSDVDLHGIVTGSPLFGLDMEVPNMVYATIIKPEIFGAKLSSFEASKAKALEGVIDVFKVPAMDNPTMRVDGVAILAQDTWTAFKAKKLVETNWEAPDNYITSSADLKTRMGNNLQTKTEVLKEDGDVDKAFETLDDQLTATYEVPFISHSQMEPMNFIADVKDNEVLLVGPTQTPGSASAMASRITGIPRENIKVKFSRIGGGFGRRLTNDYANEAVFISMTIKKPVKLVWDRESDFLCDFYRPAGCYHFKAAMEGKELKAMEVKACTTSRYLYRGGSPAHGTEAFPDQQPAGLIPNFKISYAPLLTNVPVGALRTPGMNAVTFAYQSFIDELASHAEVDPIDFQLKMIGEADRDMPYSDHGGPTYNTSRLRQVIKMVRNKADWNKKGSSIYQGFAAQMVFGAYVAAIVDVRLNAGKIQIEKVNIAVDCGLIINPVGAEAQVQGGITDAISAALYEGLEIKDGKPVAQNFNTYQKLRMPASPQVDVHFIESSAAPQGLGEPSYPILFPALINGVSKATGKRVRELPLRKHGLV